MDVSVSWYGRLPVFLALAPLPLLGAALVWVAGFFLWRYVSLASILADVSLPLFAWLFRWLELGPTASRSIVTLVFLCILSLAAILRHLGNIKRLLAGTESRFGKSEPEPMDAGEAVVTPEDASRKPEE